MPNFEEIYQKKPNEMDEGEFKIALFGYLHGFQAGLDAINERLDVTNGKVKCIPELESKIDSHGKQLGWIWAIIGTLGGALSVALLKYIIGF